MPSRKYRIDRNGEEKPVWASKRRLQMMGREEAAKAIREHRQPIHYGNLSFDTACQLYFQQLTNERKKDRKTAGR